MAVPRERFLALMKAQCQLFSQVYNPDGLRIGTNVLRQRLRGPAMAAYYPRKMPGLTDLNKIFGNQLYAYDEDVEGYFDRLNGRKERGRSQPLKKTKPPPANKKKKR